MITIVYINGKYVLKYNDKVIFKTKNVNRILRETRDKLLEFDRKPDKGRIGL